MFVGSRWWLIWFLKMWMSWFSQQPFLFVTFLFSLFSSIIWLKFVFEVVYQLGDDLEGIHIGSQPLLLLSPAPCWTWIFTCSHYPSFRRFEFHISFSFPLLINTTNLNLHLYHLLDEVSNNDRSVWICNMNFISYLEFRILLLDKGDSYCFCIYACFGVKNMISLFWSPIYQVPLWVEVRIFLYIIAVSALLAVKKQLVDPKNNLRNWDKGDPCTSNWTGILCFNNLGKDGYLHVQELYVFSYHSLHSLHRLVIGLLLHFSIVFHFVESGKFCSLSFYYI